MTVQHLNVLFAGIVITAVVITVAAYLMHAFYRRASAIRAFVRTGFGGRKVVLDGGAFVIPIFHEVVSINMNTLRLEVRRVRDAALITKDRMRVDVVAAFYVRVQPTREAIIRAAQTLGQRTNQIIELTELLEGKFVDALRAVAAEMTMEEMHEKRGEFAAQVKALVSADLETDGLELEAVSLTDMDQTGMEFFDPSNAFDAEGPYTADRGNRASKKGAKRYRTGHDDPDPHEESGDGAPDPGYRPGDGIRPARATAGSGNPPGLATGGNLARESGERAQLRGSPDPISS